MLACEYVVTRLLDYGIDTFFILTGGAIAPFIDAIARESRARYYCFQHEQAASMAVDGYYRTCGRMAVVVVTSGPGAQNIMNGLCGCYYDSIPALFITGQVNMRESLDAICCRPRQVGFQEMPVTNCFEPFTKYVGKLTSVDVVPFKLRLAVESAQSSRKGPALLDFPVNVQMSEIATYDAFGTSVAVPVRMAATSDAVSSLLSSKRPCIVVGNGARNAASALLTLLARVKIPFVTTWAAVDILQSNHPLNAGHFGVYGDRVANFAIQNADFLIVLGARLDTRQTGGNLQNFSKMSRKLMVDIDPDEIMKLPERGLNVEWKFTMDVSDFLEFYLTGLNMDVPEWTSTLATWRREFGIEVRPIFEGYVSPYKLLAHLNDILPDDAVLVLDTGATLVWGFQSLKPRRLQRVFSNLGNSSMGYALPAAIGAAIASPSRLIVCLTGDGGMQQNIQELATALHYNLNIKIFVFNNSGYGIIKQFQNSYLSGRHIATSGRDLYGVSNSVDFVAVALAYSVKATRVYSIADVPALAPGLELFDVIIHENQTIQPKTDFGNSLENMSPFIDSASHMIITPAPRALRSGWVRI